MILKVVVQSKETAKEGIPLFLDMVGEREIIVEEPSHFGIIEQGTVDGKLACFILGNIDGKMCSFKMSQNIFNGMVEAFHTARKRFNV
jgi:hypothetical protein